VAFPLSLPSPRKRGEGRHRVRRTFPSPTRVGEVRVRESYSCYPISPADVSGKGQVLSTSSVRGPFPSPTRVGEGQGEGKLLLLFNYSRSDALVFTRS
jgi:hypothetical protein